MDVILLHMYTSKDFRNAPVMRKELENRESVLLVLELNLTSEPGTEAIEEVVLECYLQTLSDPINF